MVCLLHLLYLTQVYVYKFKLLFTFLMISIGGLCVYVCFQFAYISFFPTFFSSTRIFSVFHADGNRTNFSSSFHLSVSRYLHYVEKSVSFLNINIFSIVPNERRRRKKTCLRMLLFPRQQHTANDRRKRLMTLCVTYQHAAEIRSLRANWTSDDFILFDLFSHFLWNT